MAYDEARRVVVLFGGSGQRDTWTLDGDTWQQKSPTQAPPGGQASMAFDRARQIIVATVQGSGPNCPVDTWTWDGSNWAKLAVIQPKACSFGSAYDSKENVVRLAGILPRNGVYESVLWNWNGTGWTEAVVTDRPDARYYSPSYAYDESKNDLLSYGGDQATNTYDTASTLYRLNDGKWSIPSAAPSSRQRPALSPSPGGGIVLFGGLAYHQSTWTFDGTSWQQERPTKSPNGRSQAMMAFDEKRNEVVLFGGITNCCGVSGETWIWNGITWTQRFPAHSPAPLPEGAATYDPIREKVLLLEGYLSYKTRVWTWDGVDWTLPAQPTAPEYRTRFSWAFDRARGLAVLFGGKGPTLSNQTWTWDGSTWRKLAPAMSPSHRAGAAMAWDDLNKQLVLFGGNTLTADQSDEVWRWDGQTWSSLMNLNPTAVPAARADASMAPFGSSGRMLMTGGYKQGASLGDQWLFHTRGGSCAAASECATGSCVDGVCCEAASCGSCETCAGADPGVCESIRNAEDPDSCAAAGGKRCDAEGRCRGGNGSTCSTPADCSAGYCVDGFCCNTACDLPCEACAAETKLVRASDGRCGPAKIGSNPGGRCGSKDTCNADGACETRTNATCTSTSTLDLGNGTTEECAPYLCSKNACAKTCTTYKDCAFPATCSTQGRCETLSGVADSGGCAFAPSKRIGARDQGAHAVLVVLIGSVMLARKRRRAAANTPAGP